MHLAFPRLPALSAVVTATLISACGGGSGGTNGSTESPPTPTVMSGVVIDGPLQGATVCLDLNRNGACDNGEPASAATDAQGRYSITGLSGDQLNAGAPIVAEIPATAVDTSTGAAVGKAYTLQAPADKTSVISPVTTLIQAGVAQGLTLSAAEAAVAKHLRVSAGSLYNNYMEGSGSDDATLAAAVPALVASMQASVNPPPSSNADYHVRLFDAHSSLLRFYYSDNHPDSSGAYTYYDIRQGGALYEGKLVATTSGWQAFDSATPNTFSAGNPSRVTWAYGHTYLALDTDIDVSGKPIADVVKMAQDLSANSVSTIVNIDPASLAGTMPPGAKLRRTTLTAQSTPIYYNEIYSPAFTFALDSSTLVDLAHSYTVPARPTQDNTVLMGNLHANNTCTPTPGTAICPKEEVRAAFGTGNTAAFYLCDYDKNGQTSLGNCSFAGTGTYAVGVAVDGITPILTFDGIPAAIDNIQIYTRVFVQRGKLVYYGYKEKLITQTQTRLNKVAFEALAAAAGFNPPAISAFAGTWQVSYLGGDTGSCSAIVVDALGRLVGNCTSTSLGGSFAVSGTVASDGTASFSTSGGTSSGATFIGTLVGTSGTGAWSRSTASGTWTASKP